MTGSESILDDVSRKIYRSLFPKRLRDRIRYTPIIQSLREIGEHNGQAPYVLLEEKHIASLRIVTDREALLHLFPKNGVAAEVGVNAGNFSRQILSITQPQQLHLIDLWDSSRYPEALMKKVAGDFAREIDAGIVKIHRGYSVDILKSFPDDFFDWLYIDTDHMYENTAQELLICQKKVKPNGIIAGHDYIQGDWKLRIRYGVVEAVNEFCVKNGWEMAYLTNETHRHISFGLRRLDK